MKAALEQVAAIEPDGSAGALAELRRRLPGWQQEMEPVKYACLGYAHCYPAVALNAWPRAFPDAAGSAALGCGFEVRLGTWPPVPGEYFAACEGEGCPVAVSHPPSAFRHHWSWTGVSGRTGNGLMVSTWRPERLRAMP